MGRPDFRFDTDRKMSDMEAKFDAWAKEHLSDQDCKELIEELKSEDDVYFGNLILSCAKAAGMDPDLTLYVWENGKAIFGTAKEKFFGDLYKGTHIVSGKLSRADVIRNAFAVAMYHGIYLAYDEELRKNKTPEPEAPAAPAEPDMEYDKYKNFKAYPTKDREPTAGEIRQAALKRGINLFKESAEKQGAMLNESEVDVTGWRFYDSRDCDKQGYKEWAFKVKGTNQLYLMRVRDGVYAFYKVNGDDTDFIGWTKDESAINKFLRSTDDLIDDPDRPENKIQLDSSKPPVPFKHWWFVKHVPTDTENAVQRWLDMCKRSNQKELGKPFDNEIWAARHGDYEYFRNMFKSFLRNNGIENEQKALDALDVRDMIITMINTSSKNDEEWLTSQIVKYFAKAVDTANGVEPSESKREEGQPMNESLQRAISVLQRAGIQVK